MNFGLIPLHSFPFSMFSWVCKPLLLGLVPCCFASHTFFGYLSFFVMYICLNSEFFIQFNELSKILVIVWFVILSLLVFSFFPKISHYIDCLA
jgi:hypothetical protein